MTETNTWRNPLSLSQNSINMKSLAFSLLVSSLVLGDVQGSLRPPAAPAVKQSNTLLSPNQAKHEKVSASSYTATTPANTDISSQVTLLEKKEAPDKSLKNRRPSVDAGLRYSSNDWMLNFLLIPKSFILKRIGNHLIANTLATILTIWVHEYHPNIQIPMTGHSLLASSLGLLLSYRTNSAYARFWEARGLWTNAKATCRNLAITVKTHLEPHSPKAATQFLQQLAAFPACLMHLCLGGAAKLPDCALQQMPPYYQDQAATLCQQQPAWPAMLLCMQLQHTLHQAELESKSAKLNLIEAAHHNAIAHEIETLLKYMSNCEKILRTPVPWTYSRHTSRFLTLWMGTLPLALIGTVNKWLVLPIVFAAGYCMLGIEEIGHLIEQPFVGDPLDGDDRIFVELDAHTGEASEIITRGRKTMPYDIGIPVCSLAQQIKEEILNIAQM